MRTKRFSRGQVLLAAIAVLVTAALACNLNPVLGDRAPRTPDAEVIFTAPEAVIALAADTEDDVYALTIEGDLLKIAPDGKSEQLYSGLNRCGFSDRNLTVLPDGDVVTNDCVDKKDTLVKIDQGGNKTSLLQLEESLISMTSDSTGRIYLGFWLSEGDINLNFNPPYLAGADYISGQVSVLDEDGNLDSIYEGGLPLSMAASEAGELYAAIWGQAGRFQPEAKDYSMCGPTKNFWIGLSDHVEIQRLAPGRQDVIIDGQSNSTFSHIAMGKKGPLYGFGKFGERECGIYQVSRGSNPQRLSFPEDEVQKNITSLAVSGNVLYFSDADGRVYRIGLKDMELSEEVPDVLVETAPTPASAKAGHWEGKPSVSFDVTGEGDMRNFKIEAPVALSKCVIELEEIDIEADGTFVYTVLIKEEDYWPGADRSDETWPTPVMTETGPMVEAIRISGKFDSPTTLTGILRILVCGNQQFLWVEGQGTETWSAEWKGPEEVAEALVASPTRGAEQATWTPVLQTSTPVPETSPQPAVATSVPPAKTPVPTAIETSTTAPVTVETPAPPLPAGNWGRIPDLPRYIDSLVADPADPRILYAGTGDYAGSGSGVYKSEDAGLSWRSVSAGLPNKQVLALAFSQSGSPTLYALVGSEVFASADGAQSWMRLGDTGFFGLHEGLLRADPGDGDVLFAMSKSDGIARSNDGGYTWLPVGEGLPGDEHSVYAMSLAIDPTDTDVIYVGTGGFVGGGHGVYKSADGGETFSPANQGMLDYRITALAVDPAHPQTVYAGGDGGDLFKSSDGGQTWSDLTGGLPIGLSGRPTIRDIITHPTTPDTVYVLADYAAVLVTRDGGTTWQALGKPGEPDYMSFTAMAIIFDSQSEPVLVVGAEGEGGWRYDVTPPSPVPTATASSPSVPLRPLPPGRWQQILDLPRQINTLVVDPSNAQVLYAGTGESGSGSGLYKSEDAGLTWRLATSGLPDDDVLALAVSRDVPPTLYAAIGREVFGSTDGAESWTHLSDSGIISGFYRQLYVAPSDSNLLFMVIRPGGLIRSNDGGYTWLPIGHGLPGDEREVYVLSLAIDPTDPNVIYAGTGGWVGQGHGVYKSSDGGETWFPANRGMLDYRISALAIDPTQPQTIYAGGDSGELFKSVDGGQTWTDLSEALRVQEYSYPRTIRNIIVDPAAPETVYLLGDNTGVMVSHDGGTRWRALAKPGEHDQPVFTVMASVLDRQSIFVVGIEREGGWRYATD